MPLAIVQGAHVRVVCDGCGADAEVCAKRKDDGVAKRHAAIAFTRAGWHFDPKSSTRRRFDFQGAWHCPECTRQKRLKPYSENH